MSPHEPGFWVPNPAASHVLDKLWADHAPTRDWLDYRQLDGKGATLIRAGNEDRKKFEGGRVPALPGSTSVRSFQYWDRGTLLRVWERESSVTHLRLAWLNGERPNLITFDHRR